MPTAMPTTIVWFRNDLRLDDNPALDAAMARQGRRGALPHFFAPVGEMSPPLVT